MRGKKLAVLAMACLMVVTMMIGAVTPALALGPPYTITIRPNGQPLDPANRFKAYQIFSGDLGQEAEQLDNITWGSNVDGSALIEAMKADQTHEMLSGGKLGDVFTTAWNDWNNNHKGEIDEPEFVAQWLAKHADSVEFADYFARLVAEHLKESPAPKESAIDGTNWKIEVDGPGYYLIVDTYPIGEADPDDGDSSVSSYILEVLDQREVDLKATIPTVDKEVEGGKGFLAGTEEKVAFTLTGTIAQNILEYDTYQYTFTDTLSEGLTMTEDDRNSLKVEMYFDGKPVKTFAKDTNYTVTYTPDTPRQKNTLTVTFTDLKKAIGLNTYIQDPAKITIVVSYTAELNDYAVIGSEGNVNDVKITYSNDPYNGGTGESVPNETKTYTLGLKIQKNDENGTAMANVKFKLAKQTNTDPQPNGTWQYAKLNYLNHNGDARYEIASWVDDIGEATEITTDATGIFNLIGLELGTYQLIETATAEDYEIMKPVTFTIESADPDGIDIDGSLHTQIQINQATLTEGRGDVSWDEHMLSTGEAQLTLRNFPSPILPHTGGIGSAVVIIAGLAILAVGGVAAFVLLRKKK